MTRTDVLLGVIAVLLVGAIDQLASLASAVDRLSDAPNPLDPQPATGDDVERMADCLAKLIDRRLGDVIQAIDPPALGGYSFDPQPALPATC